MDSIEDAEIVRCGSKAVQRFKEYEYSSLLEALTKNCTKGKETITFSQQDWEGALEVVKQVEKTATEMSRLTPVTGAVGLCKATVCQWGELSNMRDKAAKDANKVERLYKEVEHLLEIVDKLIAEKVVAANDWWTRKSGTIRSEIDNMKRE